MPQLLEELEEVCLDTADTVIVESEGLGARVIDGNYVECHHYSPLIAWPSNSVCSTEEYALHFRELTDSERARALINHRPARHDLIYLVTDTNAVGWGQTFTAYNCLHCGSRYFWSGELNVGLDNYCPDCIDQMHSCNDCLDLTHEDQMVYDEDLGGELCQACYEIRRREQRRRTHSRALPYNHKPEPDFYLAQGEQRDFRYKHLGSQRYDATPYMGMELELEFTEGSSYGETEQLVEQLWGSRAFCKLDGSVSNGLEICSQPHTLAAWGEVDWSLLTQLSEQGCRSFNAESSCGVHVHISRQSFNGLAHQYRFTQLIMRHPYQVKELAQRISDRWASYTGSNETFKVLKKEIYSDRYKAVNHANEHTIEIRTFKGTLNVKRVKAYLQFVHACHAYTKDLTARQVAAGALSFDAFRSWLWQHALPTYHELRLFIREVN